MIRSKSVDKYVGTTLHPQSYLFLLAEVLKSVVMPFFSFWRFQSYFLAKNCSSGQLKAHLYAIRVLFLICVMILSKERRELSFKAPFYPLIVLLLLHKVFYAQINLIQLIILGDDHQGWSFCWLHRSKLQVTVNSFSKHLHLYH